MRSHALAHRMTAHVKGASWSPDDLLHELQITLAALADIECSDERDCERIEQWSGSETTRARLRAERESRRGREREPYLQKPDELQDRIRAHLTSGL
jgi:hypothetical protein